MNDTGKGWSNELRQLAQIIDQIHDAVVTTDLAGRVTSWNKAAETTFGYAAAEALGRHISFLYAEEQRAFLQNEVVAPVLEKGEHRLELWALGKSGARIWLDLTLSLLRDQQNVVYGMIGYSKDITRRKQAEELLRQSEARLGDIMRHAPCILWNCEVEALPTWDRSSLAGTSINWRLTIQPDEEAAQRLVPLDVPAGQTYLGCFYESHPAEDRAAMDAQWLTALSSGAKGYAQDFRSLDRDGNMHWIHEEVSLQRVADLRWKGSGVCTDVTERKLAEDQLQHYREHLEDLVAERTAELSRAKERLEQEVAERQRTEEALRESEERYRSLVNNLSVGVYRNTPGPEGHFLQVNPALVRIHGYDAAEELQKTKVADLYQDPQEREVFVREVARQGFVRNYELRLKRKDGTPFVGSVTATAHHGADGAVDWIDGALQDITERKRVETALRASEEKYRALVETTDTGFLILDGQGRVLDANQEYVRLTGHCELREILGRSVLEWTAESAKASNAAAVAQCARDGLIRNFVTEYVDRSGRITPIEINATVHGEGESLRIISLCRDITERKRAEDKLRASEARYRRVFETVSDAAVIVDVATLQYLDVNEAATRMYGYSRDEFLRLKLMDTTAQRPDTEAAVAVVVSQGWNRVPLRYHRRKDGIVFPVEISSGAFELEGRQVIFGIIKDITQRRQAEDALQASEKRYRRIFETVSDAAVVFDGTTLRMVDVNETAMRLYGYSREEFLRLKATDTTAQLQESQASIATTLAKSQDHVPLRYHRKKDGSVFPVEISSGAFELNGRQLVFGIVKDITERKLAEDARRESEARLQLALDAVDMVVWEWDVPSGKINYSDNMRDRMKGRAMELLCSRETVFQNLHPQDKERVATAVEWAIAENSLFEQEYRALLADGQYHWILGKARPMLGADGHVSRLVGVSIDITGRRQAEEKLRQKEVELNEAQRIAHIGSWYWDATTGVSNSDELHRIFGFDPATQRMPDFNGQKGRCYTPEVWERLYAAGKRIFETNTVCEMDVPALRNGTPIWITTRSQVVRDAAGEIVCARGTVQDITERKRTEEALRQKELELSEAQRIAHIGSWYWDAKTDASTCSDELLRIYGFDVATHCMPEFKEQKGRCLPPETWERVRAAGQRTFETGVASELEVPALRSGTPIWITARNESARDATGQIVGLRGTVQDITERKRAEDTLRESEERFRRLFESVPDGVFVLDAQTGRFVDVNEAAVRLYGYSREELLRMKPVDLTAEPEATAANMAQVLAQGRTHVPVRYTKKKDGSIVPVELAAVSFDLAGRKVSCFIVHDITQRRRVEAEANELRSELSNVTRVMSLGELAAALAHEFNQPLTAIMNNAEAGQRMLAAGKLRTKEGEQILADIVGDAQRAGSVIQRIRALLKRGELELQTIDLNAVVRETEQLLRQDIYEKSLGLRATLELATGLPPVRADRLALMHVIVNLIQNSLQAMTDMSPAKRRLTVRTKVLNTSAVELAVEDNGVGIPADKLQRVFDPFFTTKLEGLGMGLRICRTLIEAHRGKIQAENNPDGGATVRFTLPLREESRP